MGIFRGGGENFDLNIAKELQRLGCQIKFLVGKKFLGSPTHPVKEFSTDYIATPYLRGLSYTMPKGWVFSAIDQSFFYWRVLSHLKKFKEKPEIIQLCSFPYLGALIKEKVGIPVVVRMPGPPSISQINMLSKLDAVIANGDAYRQLSQSGLRNAYNINPGVNINYFQKNLKKGFQIRQKYGIGKEDILFIWVGRLIPIKDPSFAIESFAKTSEANGKLKLMFVGEGPLKKNLEKLTNELKMEKTVIFTGHIEHKDLPDYYSAADVLLVTSSYDNFPNVVLEAMACELPIIATNVGGIPMQMINNANGFLVKYRDLEELKNKMLEMTENENFRKEAGKKNKEKVKLKYNWLNSAKKLKKIYENLLNISPII